MTAAPHRALGRPASQARTASAPGQPRNPCGRPAAAPGRPAGTSETPAAAGLAGHSWHSGGTSSSPSHWQPAQARRLRVSLAVPESRRSSEPEPPAALSAIRLRHLTSRLSECRRAPSLGFGPVPPLSAGGCRLSWLSGPRPPSKKMVILSNVSRNMILISLTFDLTLFLSHWDGR